MENKQVPHDRPPRVLLFPFPEQGHVKPFLNLAELLSLAGVHVTFLSTHFIHDRLLLHSNVQSHFETYTGFVFKAISDGLPDNHPRSGEKGKEDMNKLVNGVPGMEGILRFRDLPSFCRVSDVRHPILQGFARAIRQCTQGQGLILNTFEELEEPILSRLRTHCPNIYPIGPMHTHLKLKLAKKEVASPSSNSIFETDKNCITWLDSQPLKSVMYVSMGSVAVMTRDELLEFWYGLVNSKKRFCGLYGRISIRKWKTRKEELVNAADEMTKLAIKSVSEGGSSYCNFDSLIEYIYKMNEKPCMHAVGDHGMLN
ncbi:hypothetical protein FNV43_RR08496 [Rhamnella rubrinervis]|uniref:Uncharacterized protein n=1 Tax=Rhamnella rubrinervis TaxID=2594499 RepID=A0A8K0H8F8_9ROSA|nr:hypothetical protein FNV43_RR08496 [Rhamnella rubrinervis]